MCVCVVPVPVCIDHGRERTCTTESYANMMVSHGSVAVMTLAPPSGLTMVEVSGASERILHQKK